MTAKYGLYGLCAALVCIPLMCIALILTASGASGAPTLPSGGDNPMPIRFPELNRAAAPEWVTEGLRATYYMIASTSDSEGGINENKDVGSGSAGDGLVQIDVVAMENGMAATSTESYAPDLYGGMRKANSYGSVVPAGIGDFWCNPQVLQKIPEKASDDLTVQRIPFSIDGQGFPGHKARFQIGYL